MQKMSSATTDTDQAERLIDKLSSKDRHALRGDWAVLEGSIENALAILQAAGDAGNDIDAALVAKAKLALTMASEAASKFKSKLM